MGASESSQPKLCDFCGTEIKENCECVRCKAIQSSNFSYALSNKTPVLKFLHILPFEESYEDEKKETNVSFFGQEIAKPFFKDIHNNTLISRGDLFQYKGIDFKVVSCFPPRGFYDISTCILTGDYDDIKLLRAQNCLTRLRLLPTKNSMLQLKSKNISESHVKPLINSYISNKKHLVLGECLLFRGVEFKVLDCQPTNGVINNDTRVFSDGDPLEDLKRVHLLPIYETLPNREKKIGNQPGITEEQLVNRYFRPYFLGENRYLVKGQEVKINGVDFVVVAADPELGIVTSETSLFSSGEPLSAEEVRKMHAQSDENYARQLQLEETPFATLFSLGFNNGNDRPLTNRRILFAPRENQRSLSNASFRSYDRDRRLQMNMSRLLASLEASSLLGLNPHISFLNDEYETSNQGASKNTIEQLPTRKYCEASVDETSSNSKQSLKSCRICLIDYCEGNILKTLPCFHSYHTECIGK